MGQDTVRWGVFGPGSIANNFAAGVAEAPNAELVAVGGRDMGRADAYADRHGIEKDRRHVGLDALLADGGVDAVYVSTPHTEHAQNSIDALRAGKHVLCEKPAGLNAAEVRAMVDVARDCDRLLMEAFMYLFHPQVARLLEIVSAGTIGEVESVESALCFAAPYDPKSRLFDPGLAGGAIMDVGCYPVSLARLVAGVPVGRRFADPVRIRAIARKADSGVDGKSYALLEFENGLMAQCTAAVESDIPSTATVHGRIGVAHLPDPWLPGREGAPSHSRIVVSVGGKETVEEIDAPSMLYRYEAERASAAVLAGERQAPAPGMDWAGSEGNARVLEQWRDEVGYAIRHERTTGGRKLGRAVVPKGGRMIPSAEIPGVGRPVSRLVMGCDNQLRESDASVIWDAWLEAGGSAFDTAWIYEMGLIERLLGEWIDSRGVRGEVTVLVKGGHTPHCDPQSVDEQLRQSLERLRADRADVYLMHRDNPEIPAGEFIDKLSELAGEGLIGVAGASNWTLERFRAANEWAEENGRKPFSILNNNLSLAVMEKEAWKGSKTSNDPGTLAYLRETGTVHLSWSSQARGYFLPKEMRGELPDGTRPEQCFESEANARRRERANELAEKKGVSPMNVAAAWVLGQSFPSFALVGPRRPAEIATALPALDVELSEEELAWLNLESD